MQQRKQLLELEAAIINSQDPGATLNHVAQQNNMSQEELAGMLERNHKDLQESGQLEGMMGDVNASLAAQQQGGGSRWTSFIFSCCCCWTVSFFSYFTLCCWLHSLVLYCNIVCVLCWFFLVLYCNGGA